MNVTDWLRRLGLEQYEALFRENDVDVGLLPSLTTEDLKELGIASVGHRRRLLNGIAALGAEGAAISRSAAPVSMDNDRALSAQAERRHVTVLFCDLVGSTPLSVQLDPEDLRAVIGAYQQSVSAVISGLRGTLARFVGDGVLAYFGWPNADEVHAETAVRAGLCIVNAIRSQKLAVRVGIATGLVVVGDMMAAAPAQKLTAVGETPNLAARLQSLAASNRIMVSDATRSLLGRLFDMEDIGIVELKGFKAPQRVWRVKGWTALSSRSEALYGGELTALIGRDEELELLLRRWRQAKSGEGQLVLLSGEPGIGKSRLIAELERRLLTESYVSMRYFCSPHHQDSPLHPIIARWEQDAGFAKEDSAAEHLDKLEALLAGSTLPTTDVALLALMLSVPTDGRYPRLDFSPQLRKERTFAALARRLKGLAKVHPVLFLFEDAHWADPTSLELLTSLIDQLTKLPVLLVVTFRSGFHVPGVVHAGMSVVTLNRLDWKQSATLVAQITAAHSLPPMLLERIVAQTDGVPLFIEELTKAVLEGADQRGSSEASVIVPPTLQSSLMARLDRLPAAKHVAQIGAAIGREFSQSLLVSVARATDAQLAQGLHELVASGLAVRREAPPDAVYVFKHVLVQETAYSSLLRSRRIEIHTAIVDILERDREIVYRQPALLGYHCAQARLIEKAAAFYRMTGERSGEFSAYVETISILERGLTLAKPLPDSIERRRLEAELLIALGRVLHVTKGMGDLGAATALEEAIRLSRTLDDSDSLVRALSDWWINLQYRGALDTAQVTARELLNVGKTRDDSQTEMFGHAALGLSHFLMGQLAEARACQEAAQELRLRRPDTRLDPTFGVGFAIGQPVFSAYCLACLGYLDQAAVATAAAVSLASGDGSQLGPAPRGVLLTHLCRVDLLTRDIASLVDHTASLALLAEQQRIPQHLLVSRYFQCWLKANVGHAERIHEMRATLMTIHAQGSRLWGSHWCIMLAGALMSTGHFAHALPHLDEGLSLSEHAGETWLDAELHRLKGEALLALPSADPAGGEQELRQAIEVARNQCAKLFELRAATSLARLWLGTGNRAEARSLLLPIYAWFTEGLDRPDLCEARGLLTDLGSYGRGLSNRTSGA